MKAWLMTLPPHFVTSRNNVVPECVENNMRKTSEISPLMARFGFARECIVCSFCVSKDSMD
jgi:hypothetical protein